MFLSFLVVIVLNVSIVVVFVILFYLLHYFQVKNLILLGFNILHKKKNIFMK